MSVYIIYTGRENVKMILTNSERIPTIAVMGKERHEDPVMDAVRQRFEESGLTLQALGDKMGYPSESARQSIAQFMKTGDPQISLLRRFAKALGISVATLLK
jgi:hypothetical protein